MRKSKSLAKIRAGKPVKMCVLGHYMPAYVRHAAHFGYDCIWLDLEHRLIGEREVQALLAVFHLADIDCMLRAPTLEKTRLYRYLEDGATGLMIPHVSTAEKARMLVDAVKFPPVGNRGLDGAGLDAEFYLQETKEYIDRANEETFLVVQIETLEAVENVDEIAVVEGVDGLFVGPGDLSMRIERTPNCTLTLDAAYESVASAAARNGKAWGCPGGSAEQVKKLHQQGAQLIAYGGEFKTLMDMLKNCSEQLDELYGQ